MKLHINGEIKDVNFATLGEWVAAEFGSFENGIKGMAVAVNDCVVPSSKWNASSLKEGDRILVVQATQGG